MKSFFARYPLALCGFLWCLLLVTILLTRPLFNTIETRAMTVAWEMHVRGNFLLPTLNFEPYTQKPPLLSWLINLGWLVFGTQRWVATVIAGAFGFGCIVWTRAIARVLWPTDDNRIRQATWLCFGSIILQIFGTLIFYDVMLTCFTLGCIYMLLQTLKTNQARYYWGLVACVAFAGFSKGPVVLVHILSLILLAPFWSEAKPHSWKSWYAKIIGSILLGAACVYGWAIPAAIQGGPEYARWIFIEQTTKRVVKAFNHQEPWWYYLMVGPALLLPWLFIPSLWRKLPALKHWKADPVQRFLLCWIVPVFVVFSAISGKQLHYLLPIWPAFVLLMTALWQENTDRRPLDWIIGFLPFILFGMAFCGLAIWTHSGHGKPVLQDLFRHAMPFAILYLVLLVTYIAIAYRKQRLVSGMARMMIVTLILFHMGTAPNGFVRFTTQPTADALAQYPDRPAATVTQRYQGDYNYTARVTKPLTILPPDQPAVIHDFFAQHPDGVIVMEIKTLDDVKDYHVLATQPARAKYMLALIER